MLAEPASASASFDEERNASTNEYDTRSYDDYSDTFSGSGSQSSYGSGSFDGDEGASRDGGASRDNEGASRDNEGASRDDEGASRNEVIQTNNDEPTVAKPVPLKKAEVKVKEAVVQRPATATAFGGMFGDFMQSAINTLFPYGENEEKPNSSTAPELKVTTTRSLPSTDTRDRSIGEYESSMSKEDDGLSYMRSASSSFDENATEFSLETNDGNDPGRRRARRDEERNDNSALLADDRPSATNESLDERREESRDESRAHPTYDTAASTTVDSTVVDYDTMSNGLGTSYASATIDSTQDTHMNTTYSSDVETRKAGTTKTSAEATSVVSISSSGSASDGGIEVTVTDFDGNHWNGTESKSIEENIELELMSESLDVEIEIPSQAETSIGSEIEEKADIEEEANVEEEAIIEEEAKTEQKAEIEQQTAESEQPTAEIEQSKAEIEQPKAEIEQEAESKSELEQELAENVGKEQDVPEEEDSSRPFSPREEVLRGLDRDELMDQRYLLSNDSGLVFSVSTESGSMNDMYMSVGRSVSSRKSYEDSTFDDHEQRLDEILQESDDTEEEIKLDPAEETTKFSEDNASVEAEEGNEDTEEISRTEVEENEEEPTRIDREVAHASAEQNSEEAKAQSFEEVAENSGEEHIVTNSEGTMESSVREENEAANIAEEDNEAANIAVAENETANIIQEENEAANITQEENEEANITQEENEEAKITQEENDAAKIAEEESRITDEVQEVVAAVEEEGQPADNGQDDAVVMVDKENETLAVPVCSDSVSVDEDVAIPEAKDKLDFDSDQESPNGLVKTEEVNKEVDAEVEAARMIRARTTAQILEEDPSIDEIDYGQYEQAFANTESLVEEDPSIDGVEEDPSIDGIEDELANSESIVEEDPTLDGFEDDIQYEEAVVNTESSEDAIEIVPSGDSGKLEEVVSRHQDADTDENSRALEGLNDEEEEHIEGGNVELAQKDFAFDEDGLVDMVETAAQAKAEAEISELQKRLENEEMQRRKNELAARKFAEQEAERMRLEVEAKINADRETARIRFAEEEARIRAEQEAYKLQVMERARIAAEREAARLQEEEDARNAILKAKEEERLRLEEEARVQAENERKRKAEAEAARRREEEEMRMMLLKRERKAEAEIKAGEMFDSYASYLKAESDTAKNLTVVKDEQQRHITKVFSHKNSPWWMRKESKDENKEKSSKEIASDRTAKWLLKQMQESDLVREDHDIPDSKENQKIPEKYQYDNKIWWGIKHKNFSSNQRRPDRKWYDSTTEQESDVNFAKPEVGISFNTLPPGRKRKLTNIAARTWFVLSDEAKVLTPEEAPPVDAEENKENEIKSNQKEIGPRNEPRTIDSAVALLTTNITSTITALDNGNFSSHPVSFKNSVPNILPRVSVNSDEIVKKLTVRNKAFVANPIKPTPQVLELIAAIYSDSLSRRSNACGTLKVMASQKKNVTVLGNTEGILDALVFVAKRNPEDYSDEWDAGAVRTCRQRALTAIALLSQPRENRRAICEHKDLIPFVLQTLKGSQGEERLHACSAVAALAKTEENKNILIEKEGLVLELSNILASLSDDTEIEDSSDQKKKLANQKILASTRLNACAALLHLSKQCNVSAIMCADVNILRNIASASKDLNDPVHSRCLETLCQLTRLPSNSEVMAENVEIVDALKQCGVSENSIDRLWTMRAMQNLTAHASNRDHIASVDMLEMLCDSIERLEIVEEHEAAISALGNLCTDPSSVVQVINTENVVSVLVNVTNNIEYSAEIQFVACDALATIAMWLQKVARAANVPEGVSYEALPTLKSMGYLRYNTNE